jgi:two-component system, NarL family, nitrate/nitrite response regulator NarL
MRIILADHHAQPLWALKTLLEEEPEFDLVGEAVNAQDLLSLADKQIPDLVLVDRELPGDRIQDLIATLHALKPRPIIIVMSSEIASSRLVLRAGADAFISKGDDPDWLLEQLHKYAKQITIEEEANRNKF